MELNLVKPAQPNIDQESADKTEKRIFRGVGKAIHDFKLTEEGDRVMVAVSGGKDSWALLYVLNELKKRAPVNFEIIAVNIDQGYAGFRQDIIIDYIEQEKIPYHMIDQNIAKIVEEKSAEGSLPCSLCSRLRRGVLYGAAEKLGCNKIALGHHLDDFIETLLLNIFYIGHMGSMAPKLKADDGNNIVIRPLVYVEERDIIKFARDRKFPVICCQCPLQCSENTHINTKKRMIKKLITNLKKENPNIRSSLIGALGNVQPSHLLDKNFWEF
jgi:tRNA 2-thiocytidine biosynthesis protein TtcA